MAGRNDQLRRAVWRGRRGINDGRNWWRHGSAGRGVGRRRPVSLAQRARRQQAGAQQNDEQSHADELTRPEFNRQSGTHGNTVQSSESLASRDGFRRRSAPVPGHSIARSFAGSVVWSTIGSSDIAATETVALLDSGPALRCNRLICSQAARIFGALSAVKAFSCIWCISWFVLIQVKEVRARR